eukprot:4821746-Prymnesium_polylepis.1
MVAFISNGYGGPHEDARHMVRFPSNGVGSENGSGSTHSLSPGQQGIVNGCHRLASATLHGGGALGGTVGGGGDSGGAGGGEGGGNEGGEMGGGEGGRQMGCVSLQETRPGGDGSTTSRRPSQHGTFVTVALVWPASTASVEFHVLTMSATVHEQVARHMVLDPPHTQGSASAHSLRPAQHGKSEGQ